MKWLQENNIPYRQRNVSEDEPLKAEEILNMLSLVEDIDILISSRARVWKSVKNIEDMCIKSELVPFIQKNTIVLRFPIVLENRRELAVVTGFKVEEYGLFFSKTRRKNNLKVLLENVAI